MVSRLASAWACDLPKFSVQTSTLLKLSRENDCSWVIGRPFDNYSYMYERTCMVAYLISKIRQHKFLLHGGLDKHSAYLHCQ